MFPLSESEIEDLYNFFDSKNLLNDCLNITHLPELYKSINIKTISIESLLKDDIEQSKTVISFFANQHLTEDNLDEYINKLTKVSSERIIIAWPKVGSTHTKSIKWINHNLEIKGYIIDDTLIDDLYFFLLENYITNSIYIFNKVEKKIKTIEDMIDDVYRQDLDILSLSDYEVDFLRTKSTNVEKNILSFIDNKSEDPINRLNRVTANIATYPARFESLLQTLDSIKGQFDEVRIYLNNYDFVPNELLEYTTHIGEDLTDNGKFFWSNNSGEYYFTLDDDTIYPPDYVEKTLPFIRNRIVSYHGRKLLNNDKSYFFDQKIYSMDKQLLREVELDVFSTGVSAFDTNFFKPTIWRSPNKRNTDLLISLEASIYGMKIVSLPKQSYWIKSTKASSDGIFSTAIFDETIQRRIAKMIEVWKQDEKKIYETVSNHILTKDSNKILIEEICKLEFDNFYHFNCGDGKTIGHLSKIRQSRFVGIERDPDRIEFCKRKFSGHNILFLEEEFEKLPISQNSVVLVSDSLINFEHTFSIWQNLKSNSYLITTKKLHTHYNGFLSILNKGLQIDFFIYYKEKKQELLLQHPYQKTYVINLPDCNLSEERVKLFSNNSQVFNNVEIFSAVKGRTKFYSNKVVDTWTGTTILGENKTKTLTDGEVGCCMSHIGVWEKIIQDDIEVALILEDDAVKYLPGFDNIVQDLFQQLPDDWDIFLTGYWSYDKNDIKISEMIYKCEIFILAHAYFITKKACQKILESHLPLKLPLDNFLSSVSKELNIYRHNYGTKDTSSSSNKRIPILNSYLIRTYSDCSVISKHTGEWLIV
jgi:GR25 family glycosyltransferase involved in LPS biosynthesis